MDESLLKRVEESLDQVRPYLKVDGGNIEVVEITEDNILKVRLLGACENCNMSYTTMKAGIEETIKKSIPEIKEIIAINALYPKANQ